MFEVISGARQVDSSQIEAHAGSVATALTKLGVSEGDAVLLILKNDIEFLEASQAIVILGAYPVPVNWHGTAGDVEYIARDIDAKLAIVHDDLLHLVGTIADVPLVIVPGVGRPKGESPSLDDRSVSIWANLIATRADGEPPKAQREPVIYTSGTTGKPKGVRRQPPRDLVQGAAMRALLTEVFDACDGMRTLVLSPLYHGAPASYIRIAMAAMKTSGLIVIHQKFDAEAALKAIEEHRIDRLWMVPAMFVAMTKLPREVRDRYDVSSLRYVIHSAAPCPPDVKAAILDWFGPVLFEFYGSTEVGPVTIASPADFRERRGTVGRKLAQSRIEILAEDGTILKPSEIGEIACLNTSWAEFTYWNRDADRRALDRGDLVATGDIGYFDEDGYLFLCDRKSQMIISGGVNIYPAEIEAIALQHPAVKDCAAFGIPDENFGEAVALAVEMASDPTVSEEDLKAYLKARMAGYKVPKLIQFLPSLPREDSGKIFKQRLRAPFWESLGRQI